MKPRFDRDEHFGTLKPLAALRARCGEDVVRLTSARDAIIGFPRRLLPIKRWLLAERRIPGGLGEAFVRCTPGLRELHLFNRAGERLLRVSFFDSLDCIDEYVWRLMHQDQRPGTFA